MKKIAIALMCMIVATGAAMAQKTFTFGPKVGVDYTHMWGEDVEHGGQINYQAGVFMEYRFNDKFSIAPEVVFAAQGGKFDWIDSEAIKVTTTENLNYVNIPVMLIKSIYRTSLLEIAFQHVSFFSVSSMRVIVPT